MTLSEFLCGAAAVVSITGHVSVAYYAFPAYKRCRRFAFLLLASAGGLGTFLTVSDCTFGRHLQDPTDYYWWWGARTAATIVYTACWAGGVVLLTRVFDTRPPAVKLRNYFAEGREDSSYNEDRPG